MKLKDQSDTEMQHSHIRTNLGILLLLGIIGATIIFIGSEKGATASAAALDHETSAPSTDILQAYWWHFLNDTDEAVYGEWSVQEGGHTSSVHFNKESPLSSGQEASNQQVNVFLKNPYWMGKICYHNLWWGFGRVPIETKSFTLINNPENGYLEVEYIDGKPKVSTLTNTHENC